MGCENSTRAVYTGFIAFNPVRCARASLASPQPRPTPALSIHRDLIQTIDYYCIKINSIILFKMFKSLILVCAVLCVVIEARPKWQFLPPVPGYVPVYIRTGDTPLEEINPDLAEAFHALPAGRSAGKLLEASPEVPEQADQPQPEVPEPQEDAIVDRRPYDKKFFEKKTKKVISEISKPIERR